MYDFDRRSFIKVGSIAAFHWLTLGDALNAQAETKRGDDVSVIHLFLTGGMRPPGYCSKMPHRAVLVVLAGKNPRANKAFEASSIMSKCFRRRNEW